MDIRRVASWNLVHDNVILKHIKCLYYLFEKIKRIRNMISLKDNSPPSAVAILLYLNFSGPLKQIVIEQVKRISQSKQRRSNENA